MATVKLSPIGNEQFFLANGAVNASGYLNTYEAGTSTPVATYTTSAGSVQNPTSIQLGTDGRPPDDIWIIVGTAVKFVLADSTNTPLSGCTWDNIPGINDNTGLGVIWCGTATGTANALVLTPATPATAYTAGAVYYFKSGAAANTAATTVNISALGTIAAQLSGAALSGGEIDADSWYQIVIDESTTSGQISKIGITKNATFGGNVSITGTLVVTGALSLTSGKGSTLSGYTSGVIEHIKDDSASSTAFDVDAAIGGSWESVGPTGSSATNIWTALDAVPATATAVKLKVDITGTSSTNTLNYSLYGRATGSSLTNDTNTLIGRAYTYVIVAGSPTVGGGCYAEVTLPIDSSGRFDLYATTSGSYSMTANLTLLGWIN